MSLIWIVNILSVFFLCVFFAGIVIPQILLIAFRRRLFDEPDERKIHQCVVPRLGGMAFKPVVFFSFVLLLAVNVSTGHDELLKEIGAEALPLAYAFCAIIMLHPCGIADDLIGVRLPCQVLYPDSLRHHAGGWRSGTVRPSRNAVHPFHAVVD